MERISEAIALAERLEDKIDSYDEWCDDVDPSTANAWLAEILDMSRGVADLCERLMPIPGMNYHRQLPSRVNEVLAMLKAYQKLKEMAA